MFAVDGGDTFFKLIVSLANILAHILLGIFNPFNSFGDHYCCINLFQGIIRIPGYYLHNLPFQLGKSNLRLSSISWDKILVTWSYFSIVNISIHGLDLCVSSSSHPGSAGIDGTTEIITTTATTAASSSVTGQADTGSSRLKLPWWLSWLPNMQISLIHSNLTVASLLQVNISDVRIFLGCEIKEGKSQIFAIRCDVDKLESCILPEEIESDPSCHQRCDGNYVFRTVFRGKEQFPLYFDLPNASMSCSIEFPELDTGSNSIVSKVAIGDITAFVNVPAVNYLCEVGQRLSLLLRSQQVCTGKTFEAHSSHVFATFMQHVQLSKNTMFDHIAAVAALNSHGHSQSNMPLESARTDKNSLSFVDYLSMFSPSIEFSITSISFNGKCAALSPSRPLQPQGHARKIFKPKPVEQEIREVNHQILNIFSLNRLDLSMVGSLRQSLDVSVSVQSLHSFNKLDGSGQTASSPDDFTEKVISVRVQIYQGSSSYLFGRLDGFVRPLELKLELTMLSQLLYLVTHIQSACAWRVPLPYRPKLNRQGEISALDFYRMKFNLPHRINSEVSFRDLSNSYAGFLRSFIVWTDATIEIPLISLRVCDSNSQFSYGNMELLRISIRSGMITLASMVDEASMTRSDGDDIDDENYEMIFTLAQEPERNCAVNFATISFDEIVVVNGCNVSTASSQLTPNKYGLCNCTVERLQAPIVRINRPRIRLSWEREFVNANTSCVIEDEIMYERQFIGLIDVYSKNPSSTAMAAPFENGIDRWSDWLASSRRRSILSKRFSTIATSRCSVDVTSIVIAMNQFDVALAKVSSSILTEGLRTPSIGYVPLQLKVVDINKFIHGIYTCRNEFHVNCQQISASIHIVESTEAQAVKQIHGIEVVMPGSLTIESFSVGNQCKIGNFECVVDGSVIVSLKNHSGCVNNFQVSMSPKPVLSTITYPVNAWHSGSVVLSDRLQLAAPAVGIFHNMTCTSVSIGAIAATLDYDSLDGLFYIQGYCEAEARFARSLMAATIGRPFDIACPMILPHKVLCRKPSVTVSGGLSAYFCLSSPISTTIIEIGTFLIQFEQSRVPLMDLSMQTLQVAIISFGPHLNQICGSFCSWKCVDRTFATAIHQTVIGNINSSASMMNRFDFHFTSLTGECSVLELRGAFVRVVYLQRPVMACVMYFRDYLIPAFGVAWNKGFDSRVSSQGYEQVAFAVIAAQSKPFGQFRLSIELLNAEAHIPTNANGTDCLTAYFPRLFAFKGAFELNRNYCMGPNLGSGVWISELASVRQLFKIGTTEGELLGRSRRRSVKLSQSWSLSHRSPLLIAPPSEYREVKVFKLDIECENASLCSWCNRNEIGSSINLRVFLTVESAAPSVDGIYASVFESLGYWKHDRNNRSKITVDISADEVDWTISQGQYMAIVYLIQQNIPEFQGVVRDLVPPPVNKLVNLDACAFERYSLEKRIPLFTTVPIHIAAGRLSAVDNEPEYYDLLSRLLFVDDNFGTTKAEGFPTWSNHHFHRSKIFSGCSVYEEDFWNIVKQPKPVRKESRRPSTMDDPNVKHEDLATIVKIYFKQLEVDFWKLHYGAGAGIDVAALNFVITCSRAEGDAVQSDANEILKHFSVDLEESPAETIIFAPKSFPQLCKVAVNSHLQNSPERGIDDYSKESDSSGHNRVYFDDSGLLNVDGSPPDDTPVIRSQRRHIGIRDEASDCDSDLGSTLEIQSVDGDVEFESYETAKSSSSGDSSWHGDLTTARGAEGINKGDFVPQLRYRQQGVANLRRCVVDMLDCILITHIRPIMAAVSYFVDPITLNNMRGNELLAKEGYGPLDFKAGLDVEVHSRSTVVGIPKFSTKEGMSVICIHSDFDYIHAFRGFKEAGPAKVVISVVVNIYSLFLTPIHEIRVAGSESLIDPCCLRVQSVWNLHCPEDSVEHNSKILSEHMMMQNMPRKPSKTDKAFPVRLISVKMQPLLDSDGDAMQLQRRKKSVIEGDTEVSDEPAVQQVLKFKFSIKDIFFILSASHQMVTSWETRRQQKPLRERYLFLFEGDQAFRDILHLERSIDNNAYVNLLAARDEGDQDVAVESCDLDIILKNNTYNLKIAKVEFKNFNLSYSKAFDRLHMATGLTVAAWTFNENADLWEPIIESVDGSCIAASDTSIYSMSRITALSAGSSVSASGTSSESVTLVPPVRYDVFCNPVCLNAPESTTVSLIRKFSLADVITTSSIHLPPYRVVNELGVSVTCSLSIGQTQIYESEISIGNFLPIERREIAKASFQSNRRNHHRRGAATATATSITASADNDHKLGLVFELDGEVFGSKEPLSIDREGIFAFDMKSSNQSNARRKSAAYEGNIIDETAEDVVNDRTKSLEDQSTVVRLHGGGTMTVNKSNVANASLKPNRNSAYRFNIPYSLVSMRMKDDGGRELVLRSVLSFKNLSSRILFLCIRRGPITVETSISPGVEWHVPIQVAHPKSSLFVKQSENGKWHPALATLGSLILQGNWGAPTKVKAEICCCPTENIGGMTESDWMLLLRPEVKDAKGGGGGTMGSRTFVPVKYPARDTSKHRQAQIEAETAAALSAADTNEVIFGFNDLYNSSFTGSSQYRSAMAQPMCFQLIAPLQLCNLVCQPLLYRIADNDGLIVSEGTLLPGELIDLHSVYQLFAKRIFISIRFLNYCWSKWTKILSKNNPFPSTEKMLDIVLVSMNLSHQGSELLLPNIDVVCAMRENLVRISCPVIIRNCTGLQLDIAETSALDIFTPHSSQPPIETVVAMKLRTNNLQANQDEFSSSSGSHFNNMLVSPDEASLRGPVAERPNSDGNLFNDFADATSEFDGKFYSAEDAVTSSDLTVRSTFSPRTPDLISNNIPSFSQVSGISRNRTPAAVTLTVHLPFDHMSKIEVVAAPDWTLASVFAKIISKIVVSKAHKNPYSYVFLKFDSGADGPGYVSHSPAVEANLFGPRPAAANQAAQSTKTNGSSAVLNDATVVNEELDRHADDDDEDDDDETPQLTLSQDSKQAEILSAHIAKKAAESQTTKSSFFSRRSITGMFSTNASTNANSANGSSATSFASGRMSQISSPNADLGAVDGIPPSMAFGMIADCSLYNLSMETRVEQLTNHRIRLCHITEFRVYEQIQNIKSETVITEGIMTMFRGSKIKRRTVFEKLDGDLPFNPKKSMLGFSPSLSLRVAHLTGWSNPMELYSANFGSGTDFVSLNSIQYSSNKIQDVHFEFGAYAERGKGFYQNILCVTIVPKHIIVSKLRLPMVIRQLGDSELGRSTILKPGSIQNYHYPVMRREKYLQLQRISMIPAGGRFDSQSHSDSVWYGEIDITRIGIVFVKLRNPLFIVKIQVEVVGATLIATFAPQDKQWPPYKLNNSTSLVCRYRQIMPQSAGAGAPVNPRDSAKPVRFADSAFNSDFAEGEPKIPWDELRQGESAAYAWDCPISGEKMLRLEFAQGPSWVGFDVSLDDVSKPRLLMLQRPLNGLSNPQAEGYLKYRDASSETFVLAYCILKGDAVYIFKDQSRNELIEVICLARSVTTAIPIENSEVQHRRDSVKLGSVFRFVDNGWGLYTSSLLGGSSKNPSNIDMNKARILLLLLADGLGVFRTVPKGVKASKEQARERADSDLSADDARESSCTATHSDCTTTPKDGLFFNENESEIKGRTSSFESTDRGLMIGSIHNMEHIDVQTFDADDELDDDVASAGDSGSSLREQLQLGVPVDQLLEYISAFTFEMFDIVHALMSIEEASDINSARSICYQLVAQGILMISAADAINEPNPLKENSGSNNVSTASSSDCINRLERSANNSNSNSTATVSADLSATITPFAEPQFGKAQSPRANSLDDHQVYDGRDSDCSDDGFEVSGAGADAITSRASITVTGLDLKELRQITPAEVLASSMNMSTKLTFGMPSLFPELAALAAASDDRLHNAKDRMTMIGGTDENEINGFSIFRPDGVAAHFHCASEHEFLGWIQGCRQNIEQTWFSFVSSLPAVETQDDELRRENHRGDVHISVCNNASDPLIPIGRDFGNISVDSFKLKLNLKVKADGPTKVLEISEVEPLINTKILSVVTGNKRAEVVAEGEESNENENSKLAVVEAVNSSAPRSSDEASLQLKREQLLREQQYALFVSVKVESVSVSVIDAEPSEVVYLNLRDIRLSVERTYQRLTIAATVQDLQVSNQLLNPAFPVALHPRKYNQTGASVHNRLMLPGLHQIDDEEFPALHLFVQQKLYHNEKSIAGIIAGNNVNRLDTDGVNYAPAVGSRVARSQSNANDSSSADAVINTKESKLMYFEMATVWLAPMELNIDEELVVRLMRFSGTIRSSLRKPDMGSLNRLHEEILSVQHHSNKSWGTMDTVNIANGFAQLVDACKMPYMDFTPLGRVSIFLYFSLLQLHPLDIVMNLHSSPSFQITSSEMTIVTILSQIDGARLCLNALIAEHAFGSQGIILDIIVKHYKASLWRQVHKLIGNADIVEGSVGLVANLGSGVYDLFYEPIEGLLDENGSFLNGLSKGGRSLASRTIGGTSGFTSKITGGIGKGVSFLTMDRDFYRNRASRRLNKTTSVSEGLYVGTKELGKNIVEGFSGIVVSPYRGWEEGGSVGFGVGIAKGILGVALKPAVGVFDLASRATEGIKHSAFGSELGGGRKAVVRSRIPRSFGRSNVLIPYNNEAAAAQFLADKLINFNRETRVMIVHHLHFIRSLAAVEDDNENQVDPLYRTQRNQSGADASEEAVGAEPAAEESVHLQNTSMLREMGSKTQNDAMSKLIAASQVNKVKANVLMYKDEGISDFKDPFEAWGMAVGNSYVALISAYRISLVEVRSTRESKVADFRFIWSCPASCMDQLYSDARGDLILSVGSSVSIGGQWNAPYPVVLDYFAQNFVIFQALLEQTIGPRLARMQQLSPSGGLIQRDLLKRYSSGIKSILLSPTKHTFQLHGYVLYEFTVNVVKKTTSSTVSTKDISRNPDQSDTPTTTAEKKEKKEPKPDDSVTTAVGHIFAKPVNRKALAAAASDAAKNRGLGEDGSPTFCTTGVPEGTLTYVYPLVDIVLLGPYKEDNGKYSLSLSRKDGARMRVLKRENADEHLFEHHKSMLTIVFPDSKSAWKWRHSIESHIVRNPSDLVPPGPLVVDKRKNILSSIAGSVAGKIEGDEPLANSINGMLVIPSSNMPAPSVEAMKIEIAKTLLLSRR